jgi:adenylosuccinate lyase
LTSQDINKQRFRFLQKKLRESIHAFLITLTSKLKDLSVEWKDIPMLQYTWTTASTVWVKKLCFVERLEEQMRLLFNIPFAAKFGGATGNYNAHHVSTN